MNDGERYDSWSVIINGIVDDETTDGQLLRTLNVGESFGCGPTLDQYCHTGIMKTRVDDCQFVVVAQNDYYAILNQVNFIWRKSISTTILCLILREKKTSGKSKKTKKLSWSKKYASTMMNTMYHVK